MTDRLLLENGDNVAIEDGSGTILLESAIAMEADSKGLNIAVGERGGFGVPEQINDFTQFLKNRSRYRR